MGFVDFAKPYDYVPREFMMHKLLMAGVQGRMHMLHAEEHVYERHGEGASEQRPGGG